MSKANQVKKRRLPTRTLAKIKITFILLNVTILAEGTVNHLGHSDDSVFWINPNGGAWENPDNWRSRTLPDD
jgi:hypothetical protein